MVLPSSSTLKKAADFVLCAMCYVQPSFFTSMMEWMGVVHDTSLDMVSHLTGMCRVLTCKVEATIYLCVCFLS